MKNTILLNNETYKASENDLPYLILYGEKSGGSHFSITLVKQLFLSGSKILFFTAFPMAKDNFLEQIGPNHSRICFINSMKDLEGNEDRDILILNSGNENLFIEVIAVLKDIQKRVVLVKNIEAFHQSVFDACSHLDKIILSGDIDRCIAKDTILSKVFNSTVIFTTPKILLPIEIPILEKWTGYLSNKNQSGIIKVQLV